MIKKSNKLSSKILYKQLYLNMIAENKKNTII